MFWSKKKEEVRENTQPSSKTQLPELPELPELPPLMDRDFVDISKKEKLPPLPAFPSSGIGDQIARQAVKQAIKEPEDIFNREELMAKESPLDSYNIPEDNFKTFEMPEQKTRENSVFVRIDKYQEALLNFQEIKKQISEIENLLKEIKELRQKEEADLSEWENEVKSAKEKLARIDSSLFKKVGV